MKIHVQNGSCVEIADLTLRLNCNNNFFVFNNINNVKIDLNSRVNVK